MSRKGRVSVRWSVSSIDCGLGWALFAGLHGGHSQAHGNYRTFYNFDTLPPPDTGHMLFLASLCWIRVEISTFKPCTTGHYQIFTLYQSWFFVPCETEFPPDSNDTQRNLDPGLSCLELQGWILIMSIDLLNTIIKILKQTSIIEHTKPLNI